MAKPEIRSIYDGKQDEMSEMSGLSCEGDPGKTKQSEKDSCDINIITARYERTGALPDMIKKNPRYGDFSDVPTYQAALDTVLHAETQFQSLDAKIRARFRNDPAELLDFVADPSNKEEIIKLGLAIARPPEAPKPDVVAKPGASPNAV